MDNRLTLSPSMLRTDVRHCVWAEHIEKPWSDKEGMREGRSASMKVTRPRRRDLFLLILAARERREEIYLVVRMFVGTKGWADRGISGERSGGRSRSRERERERQREWQNKKSEILNLHVYLLVAR